MDGEGQWWITHSQELPLCCPSRDPCLPVYPCSYMLNLPPIVFQPYPCFPFRCCLTSPPFTQPVLSPRFLYYLLSSFLMALKPMISFTVFPPRIFSPRSSLLAYSVSFLTLLIKFFSPSSNILPLLSNFCTSYLLSCLSYLLSSLLSL